MMAVASNELSAVSQPLLPVAGTPVPSADVPGMDFSASLATAVSAQAEAEPGTQPGGSPSNDLTRAGRWTLPDEEEAPPVRGEKKPSPELLLVLPATTFTFIDVPSTPGAGLTPNAGLTKDARVERQSGLELTKWQTSSTGMAFGEIRGDRPDVGPQPDNTSVFANEIGDEGASNRSAAVGETHAGARGSTGDPAPEGMPNAPSSISGEGMQSAGANAKAMSAQQPVAGADVPLRLNQPNRPEAGRPAANASVPLAGASATGETNHTAVAAVGLPKLPVSQRASAGSLQMQSLKAFAKTMASKSATKLSLEAHGAKLPLTGNAEAMAQAEVDPASQDVPTSQEKTTPDERMPTVIEGGEVAILANAPAAGTPMPHGTPSVATPASVNPPTTTPTADPKTRNAAPGMEGTLAVEARSMQPQVNTARLLHSVGQTEMRVGMRTEEFGAISIHTMAGREMVSAQISVDHAELAKALAVHVPEMQARLGASAMGSVQIDLSGQSASGGGGSPPQQQARGGRQQTGRDEGERREEFPLRMAAAAPSGGSRLDVRA